MVVLAKMDAGRSWDDVVLATGRSLAYDGLMDATPPPLIAPAGWLDALAESEAELANGQTVPGEEVMRELDECIARLEGRKAATSRRRPAGER
jgi:hypothetical protein